MNAWLVTNKYYVSENFVLIKQMLIESAKTHNIDIKVLDNVELNCNVNKLVTAKPDFVIFWDKDVKLAKYLENEGIRVFNSSESISVCDDKSLTYIKLHNKNIKMPKTFFSPLLYFHKLVDDESYIESIVSNFEFPVIVKECFGSFGKQVFLINNIKELKEKINEINYRPFIIQEFIKSSFGRDLRVYVVGDKVLGGMLRVNNSGDFRANIELGSIGVNYNLNDEQIKICLDSVKLLGLDFAGVDILFGENDEPILCEVNSNAYFNSFNKIHNINIEDHIFDHILNSI